MPRLPDVGKVEEQVEGDKEFETFLCPPSSCWRYLNSVFSLNLGLLLVHKWRKFDGLFDEAVAGDPLERHR